MVLLQVNLPRVSVAPLERDAPRTIDVKGVALRLAPERMEVEAGNVEIAQRRSLFQRIQSQKRPVLQVRRHSSASTLAKQLVKPLVAEAPYHRASVTRRVTGVNRSATERPSDVCRSTGWLACNRLATCKSPRGRRAAVSESITSSQVSEYDYSLSK